MSERTYENDKEAKKKERNTVKSEVVNKAKKQVRNVAFFWFSD